MNGELIAFWGLAALTVLGALATVTRRNPLVAATWLIFTFFSLAGLYALLSAHFLAVIQVLVYAGAIMVLFVFVIMVLDRPEHEELGLLHHPGSKLLGAGAAGFLGWRLATLLAAAPAAPAAAPADHGTVKSLGRLLLSDYLFPFEAVSLVLLVAVVGTIVLGGLGAGRAERET